MTRLDVKRDGGIVFVNAAHDAAFRKALMAGVPPALRGKMQEALAATPGRGAAAHARRYFGVEADQIFADAAELAGYLHRFLNDQYRLDGLLEWLTATGFGNDYRMIKVFAEWARLTSKAEIKAILPAEAKVVWIGPDENNG
ncbi:hypothetical protein [Bradyrhizobium sp. RT9a]|uniref:hypothetical protein n=1 Tax=Bradyrhizobium sp. RT9a TaxID=3156384 RepID=UPI0033993C14